MKPWIRKHKSEVLPSTPQTPTDTLRILPTEIFLHIFSFLDLKPYIPAHGVCKEWQCLLPLADILPARRRFFNLFHHMLSSSHFLETRPWTLKNLQSLDRQAYVDALLSQYPYIPEEFRVWILEWPARMAICGMWPGLPFGKPAVGARYDEPSRVTWLAYKADSPDLLTVVYKRRTPDVKYIPALFVSRSSFLTTWLIFDKDLSRLCGQVFENRDDHELPAFLPFKWKAPDDEGGQEDWNEERDGFKPFINTPFSDWITYQEYIWDLWLDWVFSTELKPPIRPFTVIKDPPPFEFRSGAPRRPPPPGVHCSESRYEEDLFRY